MSIKQKIFNKLDQDGYMSDSELAKIYGKEPNWDTAMEYKRQWNKLQTDRQFFKDKKILGAHKARRRCMVDVENGSCFVGREYFNEIVKDMEVDNSRPDLKGLEMYKAK